MSKEEVLNIGFDCKKCGHCCSTDSGFLAEEDFEKIAKFLEIDSEKLKEEYLETFEKFNKTLYRPKRIKEGKPYGRCIFHIDNLCSIQEVKPLYCKVVNCSKYSRQLGVWFDLNFVVDVNDPESIRQYASYLKHGETIEGGQLEDIVPDKERLRKILNYEIIK